MISIWQQHEYRTMVCGHTLRYLRFLDKQRLDSEVGINAEERIEMARLYNRLERGAELSNDEMQTIVTIADKRNRYGEYGACFIPSITSDECMTLLNDMPRKESCVLEAELEKLTSGVAEGVHDLDIMTPIITVMKMQITTFDNYTLQQGLVILNMLSKAMEENRK